MKFDCKLTIVNFSSVQLIFRLTDQLTEQKYDLRLETWHGWSWEYIREKSTVANLQSNFIIFYPYQHYELIWVIWSSLDHNSSRNLIKSSKGQNGQN